MAMPATRKRLLSLVALTLSCLCSAQTSASDNQSGTVTIFRERATNRLKMFSLKDQWPVRLHKKMTLDGRPLIDMHGQEFISFQLPAGRHLIEFENYGGPNASFDLHAGERVFVRPGFAGGQFLEAAKYTIVIVPCAEAIELGRESEPMPTKYVERPEPLQEEYFPTTCQPQQR